MTAVITDEAFTPYIRVELQGAAPMTLGEYNHFRGWDIPESEDPARPGYLVLAKDGHMTWSPKEIFEDSSLEVPGDSTRITPEVVETFRDKVTVSRLDPKTTLVSAECLSGFVVHEVSSCVDPANYDEEVGRQVGVNRINNTLWSCLGFVLQWAKNGLRRG